MRTWAEKQRSFSGPGGHDVETAHSEKLSGAHDQKIFETCRVENRCLITLDLDFSDPVRFSAGECGGIVILRAARQITEAMIDILVQQCLQSFETMTMNRELWIIEPGRVRIREKNSNS